VTGPIVFSIFLFSSLLSNVSSLTQMPSIQVIVPGTSDIMLSETGKYTIFYEYQSVVGNRVFSTGENIPGIQLNLISKETGAEVPLSSTSMSMTYTIGSRSGTGIFDFTIDKPGTYQLLASYPSSTVEGQQQGQGPEIVLSIIHGKVVDNFFGNIIGTAFGGFAIFFGSFIAGIVILVITFLKRRKAKRSRVKT
jgi:hypothetical protein